MRFKHHHLHILIICLTILVLLVILWKNNLAEQRFTDQGTTFGVSYSPRYATQLGLDPQKTYLSILEDLKVRNLRLSAYWDEVEPSPGNFDFSNLDWYLNQAEKYQANVILAVGYKLPRWPECRAPKWAISDLRENQLRMVGAVIKRYDQNPTITSYQIENEPLLDFGVCPPVDREFLDKEIRFVRTLTKKPIIITDSGELRAWRTPMQYSDIFGTTLYRTASNPWFGPFQYPLRPWFYRVKSELVRKIFAQNNQKTIISELQAEPWQGNNYSIKQFQETVDFAKKTGFSEAYLWGVEWWYYMAQKGHPEYLEFAKSLFY